MDRRDVNDLHVGKLALDILDTPLDKTLLVLGSVILRIFLQITVRACFGNRLDYCRPVFRLQFLDFVAQQLGTTNGHRHLAQAATSLCRSCRQLMSLSSRCSRASQVATAAPRVV